MTDPSDTLDTTSARRLDGNAAGGVLADLFAVDVTAARSRCASCGTTSMLGAHHLYADAPALVLRCPTCTEVVLRVASHEGRVLLDLRGAQLLTVPMPTTVDDTPAPGDRSGQ
jgi:ribosomal protein S27AE